MLSGCKSPSLAARLAKLNGLTQAALSSQKKEEDLCALCVVFSPEENLCLEAAEEHDDLFLKDLPEAVLARARSFLSAKRRREFLFNRLLLYKMAKTLDLRVFEDPPRSPSLVSVDGAPFFASISHTSGAVALMIAESPCALDAEVMIPARATQHLTARVFGEDAVSTIAADPVLGFYTLWGLRECAVKMRARFVKPQKDQGPAILLSEQTSARQREGSAPIVWTRHILKRPDDSVLLTLVLAASAGSALLATAHFNDGSFSFAPAANLTFKAL